MSRVLLPAIAAIVLAFGSGVAAGAVRVVSIKSPVPAGAVASLTINVSPKARCAISVAAGSYVPTQSSLAPKNGTRIVWRWKLRSDARPGPSSVVVRCGASGTLRTRFVIARVEPELPLAAAQKAACTHAPDRVKRRYQTELVPLLDRTLVALREQYGDFACAYGSNYYRDGGPLSYYLMSVRRGKTRCQFAVAARVVWVTPPLAGYDGPVNETYTETCASLRSS